MVKSLAELIYISRKVGKDPGWTQGGSGNTSVKTDDGRFMFIKASGTALKDMNAKKGWCKINLRAIREIGDKKLNKLPWKKREIEIANRLLAACGDKKNRPSIETNLHAFLDKYVIHLHPIAVGAFISAKNGKSELRKLFASEEFPPMWVPYANPGYCLAKKISNLCGKYQKKHKRLPAILFLEKHGLFVSASTAKKALGLVRKVIKRCENKIKNVSPYRRQLNKSRLPLSDRTIRETKQIIKDAFFAATGRNEAVHFSHNKNLAAFIQKDDTGELLKAGPLNPNEIIYLKGPVVWLEKASQAGKLKKGRNFSIAFLIKNIGLFVIGDTKTASIAEEVILGSLFIRYNGRKLGGIVALTKHEQNFIRNCGA
jgi:rhamnose utilization protein RhaD (predicted bifunctional aldolase and dehydrogenase)